MMAVLSRVPHCRPQLLPVELGTDMQHGQSMSAPPSEYHGGTSRRRRCSTTGLREAHPVPCARAAVGPQRTEQEMNVLSGFCYSIQLINSLQLFAFKAGRL